MTSSDLSTRLSARATITASLIAAAAALAGTWLGGRQAREAAVEERHAAVLERRAEVYATFVGAAREIEAQARSVLIAHDVRYQTLERRLGASAATAAMNKEPWNDRLHAVEAVATRMCQNHASIFVIASGSVAAHADEVCHWGTSLVEGKVSEPYTHTALVCALNDFIAAARIDLGAGPSRDVWFTTAPLYTRYGGCEVVRRIRAERW